MRKNIKRGLAILGITTLIVTGCGKESSSDSNTTQSEAAASTEVTTTGTLNLDLKGDYSEKAIKAEWSEEGSTLIQGEDGNINIEGSGATYEDGIVTITAAGTYVLSGTMENVQILVNLTTDENVQLVLNGVELSNETVAPIVAQSVKNLYVTLADGTTNTVSDNRAAAEKETSTESQSADLLGESTEYVSNNSNEEPEVEASEEPTESTEETEEDTPTAAIFSKADLIINGTGSLNVAANYNDGITSKDDLQIISGTITIDALDDAFVGKDSISVRDGNLTLSSETGDGLKSSNYEELDKGYIVIDGGTIDIAAGNDGMHSENVLVINSGNISVSKSYEGLESMNIVLNDGTVDVVASDDGLNVSASGATSTTSSDNMDMGGRMNKGDWAQSSDMPETMPSDMANGDFGGQGGEMPSDMPNGGGQGGEMPSDMPNGGGQGGEMPSDMPNGGGQGGEMPSDMPETMSSGMDSSDFQRGQGGGMGGQGGGMGGGFDAIDGALYINGGTLTVNASGDGLDSNGDVEMTGGTVTVSGAENGGNAAFDYNGSANITGGVLLLSGNSGMAEEPGEDSEQTFISVSFSDMIEAGTKITLTDADGKELYSYTADKSFNYVAVSAPDLTSGTTYTFTAGDQTQEVTA